METNVFNISGMHCPSCKALIERRLKKIDGVVGVEVKIDGVTTVESEKEVQLADLQAELSDTEYLIN